MRSPLDAAKGLLRKAANDLYAANTVLATGNALDTVCFHAQQATEKALKAVLALHQVRYPLTHDLGALLGLGAQMYGELLQFEELVEDLMQYAVTVRYDEEMNPDRQTAHSALVSAQRVYEWAESIVGGEAAE
jgi:HEPN domain-containing protein